MPKILMKASTPGSVDGITVLLFLKDREYDVTDRLAKAFVTDMKVAELVQEEISPPVEIVRQRTTPTPSEKTVIVSAPEVKDKKESKSTRVYELAGELKKSWKDIVKMAKKFGIGVDRAQSGLTDSDIKKIKEGFVE